MNSVFSAFKTNKNEKSQKSSIINNKKASNVLENSYENLRHIREISSSTKAMTSIVNDDVEQNLLNMQTNPIIKTTILNENDCCISSTLITTDVVDHAITPSTSTSVDSNVDVNQKTDSIKSSSSSSSSPLSVKFYTTNTTNNDNNIQQCDNKISLTEPSLNTSPHDGIAIIDDGSVINNERNSIDSSSNHLTENPCKSICNSNISDSVTSDLTKFTLSSESSNSITVDSSKTVPERTDSKNSFFHENPTPAIIMSKCRDRSNPQVSISSNSAATTPTNSRYSKPRLSISGFSNSSMPSVHGRTGGISTNNSNGGQTKFRLSTHQRNLSLDFRSMGILLPPVSQVTNTRINLTQHHRNRSLDSALQRIPEVEVSSPSAENENGFCTNSVVAPTVCSKVASSSLLSTTTTTTPSTTVTITSSTPSDSKKSIKIANTNPKKTEQCAQSKPNLNSGVEIAAATTTNKTTDNKKREDLTSLGSDDSGIICGSESDQVSLNRVRQSHESLDSGEMDAEEECIEILETTSMDEEYKMLQSDLCFYQTPEKDMKSVKTRQKNDENEKGICEDKEKANIGNVKEKLQYYLISDNRICVPIDIDDNKTKDSVSSDTTPSDTVTLTPTPTEENISKLSDSPPPCKNPTKSEGESSKSEHIKNEILFKNFFGATKNAIFKTAQSIIENHEKKNSSKNTSEVVPKKKEFFVLKSSSNKGKVSAAAAAATTNLTESMASPENNETKQIGNSLQIKLKVPGVVKCFIKEKEQPQQQSSKTEKNQHSGLLRFFESPIFNIHFAIHYLFYSKEPGVLSFIGNKIFSFPDHDVDLYIPQLIIMYIQMDELAEVLDPYLTYRCKKSVDFSLKCIWLLEAYNFNAVDLSPTSSNKKTHLSLMKELFSKKERKQLKSNENSIELTSPIKKTHHRSQSDATGLLNDSKRFASSGALTLQAAKSYPPLSSRLFLGDLTSGKAFDNGCICFESVQGTVNDLLGQKTFCYCGAPKMAAQKEFMKSLINIGKNLTSIQTKAEKTSALRMFLNLINKNLPARVWLPLHSDIPHHVVRITEEKTAVLNSKDKTPYIIYVEVVEVDDIYSSPVIMKMMPSLRHTKSEEYLESKDMNLAATNAVVGTTTPSKQCEDGNKTIESQLQQQQPQHKKIFECGSLNSDNNTGIRNDVTNDLNFTEDDVWSQEDDEITAQYLNLYKASERDAISQMSLDSCDSRDQGTPTLFNIGDVRTRHCINLNCENMKSFSNDPEDPSAAALKEPWHEKEKQIRESSPYGHLSNWRLLSAIVKCGDDLRQELMATQLLQMFKIIWQEENVDLWVRPYKIVCLSNDSGLIEPILNTVSLHQIKKNSNKSLRDYFIDEYGDPESIIFKKAQRNFMQSCAAYCLISYLLQVKDRHNGNILLHSDGHLIHIDFGFILSISPKNLGFEQSPFKLTPEFVDVMGGTSSELWTEFNHLLLKGLMAARKHMDRIINIVEIMRSNAQLPCFKNGCSGTVQNLRKRFHMNLTEQELERKIEQLVQDSLKSLSTKLYDGYQYLTNGIL